MSGWEGWLIAISSGIIAIGMIIMITTFILVFVAIRRLFKQANRAVEYFQYAMEEADPVEEIVDSAKSFFDKGLSSKTSAILKGALFSFLLWQKFQVRRKRRER